MSLKTDSADPAAVFACAVSLRNACEQAAERDGINLSETFHGGDQFWREVMRIAALFESWACENVSFDDLDDVWPYRLEERFGASCLQRLGIAGLKHFDAYDCAVVAMEMSVPLIYRDGLPLDLVASNPVDGSLFKRWRIQTVRKLLQEDEMVPMVYGDDPHDPECEPPVVALYGVDEEGLLEHIRDFMSYEAARSLALKLAPGVEFPSLPVVAAIFQPPSDSQTVASD